LLDELRRGTPLVSTSRRARVDRSYSILAPESRTTLPHFSRSLRRACAARSPPGSPAPRSRELRWPAGADAIAAVEEKAKLLPAQANAHRKLSSSLGYDDAK